MTDMYDIGLFLTDSQHYHDFVRAQFTGARFLHRLETLPASEPLPAPVKTDAFSRPHKDIYTGEPVPVTHTATDHARQLAPADSATGARYDKAYKISVRARASHANDQRYTLIGYVLVSRGKRVARDVFGKEHVIFQNASRLREKHVRAAFGIDSRFDVKQECIQYDTQRDSTRAKRSPHIPNTPVVRRPNVC